VVVHLQQEGVDVHRPVRVAHDRCDHALLVMADEANQSVGGNAPALANLRDRFVAGRGTRGR
jgi:hypothetical protein